MVDELVVVVVVVVVVVEDAPCTASPIIIQFRLLNPVLLSFLIVAETKRLD